MGTSKGQAGIFGPVNDKRTRNLPELLAPAGSWDCARAAIANGADAIYFGLERMNARIRADNFTSEELPRLMAWLHERGARGYLAMNILVFEPELAEVGEWVSMAARAGVDALIVQDVGLCRLIRSISPDLPIHGSTQMTLTSSVGVEMARELGCSLAVLSRECTIAEIGKIHKATSVPLEVFVHGALCVAYSGQCLTSEALGGRSANRGECAQACRMPYDLLRDGNEVDLGGRRYLLSPQDLMGLSLLPSLVDAGVASLKIEGRLKTPEYVAAITDVYRRALDRIAGGAASREVLAEDRYQMEMAFSRGFHTGWLEGIDNRKLVHAVHPKKRGRLLGTVSGITQGGVLCRLEHPVRPGDGVVFDAGDPEAREEGGRVWETERRGRDVWLSFERGKIRPERLRPGQRVWKTSDPLLERRLRQSWENGSSRREGVTGFVNGREGAPLRLVLEDARGLRGEASSTLLLEKAQKRAFTQDFLFEQLSRLGDTHFSLARLESHLADGLHLPLGELNRVRREAAEALSIARSVPRVWSVREVPLSLPALPERPVPSSPRLSLLVRNLAQLDEAVKLPVDRVYCELEDPKRFPEAVRRFVGVSDKELFLVPPRIHKEGEDWILKQCAAAAPDGWLVRNHDQARFFQGHRMAGDFSFNVANSLSAAWILDRWSLETVTASTDLNVGQLLAMGKAVPAHWFEVVIHQHIPMFHMEHCVFCAFLSKGKDFRDCGRPCEHHEVQLRDHAGVVHLVKADAGCRNTVFNARAQTGAEFSKQMLATGFRNFRIDLLDEPPRHLGMLVHRYRDLLEGRAEGVELWKELKLVSQLGVTRGTLAS
jgi:putative protease